MNKLLVSVGVVALLAVGVLGAIYPKADEATRGAQGQQGVQGERGAQGSQGPQGERGERGPAGQSVQGLESLLSALKGVLTSLQNQPKQPEQPKFGAIPGTDLPNPYCQGGLCTAVVEGTCGDATTTLGRIDTPFISATSTVVSALVDVFDPATTTARINLATSTLDGFAPVPGNATTTGLINRLSLTSNATTTLNTLSQDTDSRNEVGFAGRRFDVGPKSTTSVLDTLVLSVVARGEDSLAGFTNAANTFGCKYKVEFQALNK